MEVRDYLRYKILSTKELADNTIFDESGKMHPKRLFWSAISEQLDDFFGKGKKTAEKSMSEVLLLPGLRGMGKTFALLQLWHHLVNDRKVPQENILYISMDEAKQSIKASLYDIMDAFVESLRGQRYVDLKEKLFILVDEAHFDDKWDITLKVIYDKSPRNLFIVATGSSTISRMGPDLARRSSNETVFPLNFSEYLEIKHGFVPEKGISGSIRDAIFRPTKKNIEKLNFIEAGNNARLMKQSIQVKHALRHFTFYGGFANSISMKPFEILARTKEIVEKTIMKDLPKIHNFTLNSQTDIMNIAVFLADNISGSFSREKISQQLGIPVKKVDQILNSLEQAHIIFSATPYGLKNRRKPWKYYFMSPTLACALFSAIRKVDEFDGEKHGKMIENLFAFYLLRDVCDSFGTRLCYDANKESADFIVDMVLNPIPIEVGIGVKSSKQVKNSVKQHGTKHGVLVHKCLRTEMKGKVLHVPVDTFAFL